MQRFWYSILATTLAGALMACGSVEADPPDAAPDSGSCQAPQTDCDGVCTDTDTDDQNCGACGTVCDEGDVCASGRCVLDCPTGQVDCGGTCVDPNADPGFCGAGPDCDANPGDTCANNEACVEGLCVIPLSDPSYNEALNLMDGLTSSTVSLAFDGTDFWSASGGSVGGNRLASYDADGNLLQVFAPGIDFRSLFTRGDGSAPVMARGFNSPDILAQDAPGSFTREVTLAGAAVGAHAVVAFDRVRSEYVSQAGGVINRWADDGSFVGSVTLQDWGITVPGEDAAGAEGERMATAGGLYLTYHDGTLSAFDIDGNRVATTQLIGAGTSFDSHLSLSFANGLVWIVDQPGELWRGYDVGF